MAVLNRLAGEDRYNPNPANPSNDQEKFATYTRDSATLLDYAYQRYYNLQLGRFHTVDPLSSTPRLMTPQSLNRFGYASGDPINRVDFDGMCDDYATWSSDYSVTVTGCVSGGGWYVPTYVYVPSYTLSGGGGGGYVVPPSPAPPIRQQPTTARTTLQALLIIPNIVGFLELGAEAGVVGGPVGVITGALVGGAIGGASGVTIGLIKSGLCSIAGL